MSTTSVASDRFAIQSQGKEKPRLSPQNILSCTRKQQGCDGGHLDAAWRYLHKKGYNFFFQIKTFYTKDTKGYQNLLSLHFYKFIV